MSKRYYGTKEVVAVEEVEGFKTPGGSEVVRIHFSDNPSELTTRNAFEEFVSDEAIDATSFSDRKIDKMVDAVLAVVMEYNLSMREMERFIRRFHNQVLNAFDRASHYLWTEHDESWTPGSNFQDNRTILDADYVLTQELGKSALEADETETEEN